MRWERLNPPYGSIRLSHLKTGETAVMKVDSFRTASEIWMTRVPGGFHLRVFDESPGHISSKMNMVLSAFVPTGDAIEWERDYLPRT